MPQTPQQQATAIVAKRKRVLNDAMDRVAPEMADRLLGAAVRLLLDQRDTVTRDELIEYFQAVLSTDPEANTLDGRAARLTLARLAVL